MMYGNAEKRVLERRATEAVCHNSRKMWLFDIFFRLRLVYL
jgi:hypothetical protein